MRGMLEPRGCDVIDCPFADKGMGAVLAYGMSRVIERYPLVTGCLVALGDMPYIQAHTVSRLVAALKHHDLVAPVYMGQRGHPVGFSRQYFPFLIGLSGDRGAGKLLQDHAHELHTIEVDDGGVIHDVDFPEDLATGS